MWKSTTSLSPEKPLIDEVYKYSNNVTKFNKIFKQVCVFQEENKYSCQFISKTLFIIQEYYS